MAGDIHSMTGFGRAQTECAGRTISAEARSVNQRFLELRVRLPRDFSAWEAEFALLLKKRFTRGKFDFVVEIKRADGAVELFCDLALAGLYRDRLREMKERLGLPGEVSLELLAGLPDVFAAKVSDREMELLRQGCLSALEQAADRLIELRRSEGRNLRDDLLARAAELEKRRGRVAELSAERAKTFRETLLARIQDLFGQVALDPGRIEQEAVLLAERADIAEELVRLHSHLDHWRKTLEEGGAAGRKLDFLTQEINREVNTIGSKSLDAEITTLVVEMKVEVEKMREQAQNIE
jgi:uncharacterized protein (TIGR00255 family)